MDYQSQVISSTDSSGTLEVLFKLSLKKKIDFIVVVAGGIVLLERLFLKNSMLSMKR